MKKISNVILVLVIFVSIPAFGWEIHDHYKDKNGYNLQMRGNSIADLGEIVASEKRQLRGIFVGRLVQLQSDTIQKDIMSYLLSNYPEKINSALHSAGNMHNPKLDDLRKPCKEALLATRYVQSINEILRPLRYKISSVSIEKFFLIHKTDNTLFDALTWFEIEQLTSAGM